MQKVNYAEKNVFAGATVFSAPKISKRFFLPRAVTERGPAFVSNGFFHASVKCVASNLSDLGPVL